MFRRLERSVLLQFETSRVFYKCSVAFYDGKSTMFFRVVPSKTRSTFQLVAKFFFSFFFPRTLTVNSLQKYIEGWKENGERERERVAIRANCIFCIWSKIEKAYGMAKFIFLWPRNASIRCSSFFFKRKLCFTIVFLINSFPQRFCHQHIDVTVFKALGNNLKKKISILFQTKTCEYNVRKLHNILYQLQLSKFTFKLNETTFSYFNSEREGEREN